MILTQRILLIKLSALGDIVHALPVLHLLKSAGLEIDWFSYQGFSPLLEGQPLSKLITLKDRSLTTLIRATQELRARNYDMVIDLQGTIKTATLAKLTGAPVLGFAQPREAAATLLYDHTVDTGVWYSNAQHIIEANLKLGREAITKLGLELPKAVPLKYGLVANEPSERHSALEKQLKVKEICVLPATTWQSKLWPTEYWVELLLSLQRKSKANIHIVCTKHDDPIVQPLLAQLKESCVPVILHQDFKLQQLPSFFRSMDLIVGVDTGPLHIAAATIDPSSTYILGIYGPTSPKRTGPYGFAAVSAEELFEHKPLNKRHLSEDASMRTVLPELVLSRLSGVTAAIL